MSGESCGCNEIQIVPNVQNPKDSIDVRGEGEIFVEETTLDGKKVFIVKRVVYTPPSITTTANPVREVGQTVDFTWNVTINQGRNAIVRREITPAGPDLSAPFTVIADDVTRTTRGSQQVAHIEVEDEIGTVVQKDLAISFFNKVRLLYTWKDGVTAGQEITEADILGATGTLADNIKSVYGGVRSYAIPVSAVLQYIYWIYEAGTTPISAMELNGLPFPVIFFPGSIPVTNPHNGAISTNFALVRSGNKFGTQTLSLNMK